MAMIKQITQGRYPRLRLPLALVVALILLALAATGCGLTPTTTPRASDQWSNGKLLGTAILNNQVALQVDEAENSFMVWIGLEHELDFARLNEHAEVVVQTPLDLGTNSPMKPQLLMDTTGQLHLAWLDKQELTMQLFYARLSADGEVIQEATALSPPERRVTHSSMVLDPGGQTIEFFWSDNVYIRPGCYHAALDWSGAVVVPAEMLIPNGLLPSAQIDRQGFVHLAWRVEPEAEKPEFYYAVYDPQRRAMGSYTVAGEPLVQMGFLGGPTAGASFDGPWLGLDESSVYVAWVLEVRERTEVRDFTFYQAFPQPALSRPEGSATFDYSPPKVTSEPVYVRGVDPSLTGQPQFLSGQPARQVLACFTQAPGLGNVETLQIATIDVGAEQVEGQEVVNASRGASVQPSVAIDSQGNLHLVWLDTAGFQSYHVVYASTSPQAKETLNRVTTYEIADKALSTVMSFFTAIFFVPIVLNWVIIPFGWLVLFALTTRQSETSDPHGRRALGVAMILQLGIKIFLLSDLLSRSPLVSMLSPLMGLILGRWIVPMFLAAISVGVVWAYLKRSHSQSIFVAYLIYAAVDSLLTLIIYVAPIME
jgi:hypothetical protein